ncbi:hypothetical protein [Pseudogemmobacter sp. W21_MBD1_M6]|uniref:hypothetical protein n=1 Tax=Pseudogemmobacter sp. W21_MBD1_M6 TaxID=3240271 RepID=UPI003F9D9756
MLKKWWDAFAIVSIAYSISFFTTSELVTPVQAMAFPQTIVAGSLLFLPHGVRVLAAWWLGWRSVAVLLPISFAFHYYVSGPAGFMIPQVLVPVFGAVCAAVGFSLIARFRDDGDGYWRMNIGWRWIMGAGLISSLINVAGTFLTTELSFAGVFTQVFGDITGLFFMLLILMTVFRWQRIKM